MELRMASFSWEAFWKMDTEDETSLLLFNGGPRGGKSGCWRAGDTDLETGLELYPDRFPDDELDPELRDLFRPRLVLVLVTMRLDGRDE